jgi:toxin ParE1/3/4
VSGSAAWTVAFIRRAEEDILGIFDFIAEREGPDMAEAVLEKFIETRDNLRLFPDRGRIPPELKRVNILSYREIQLIPYRMIYRIHEADHAVHIHVVADGRRNFTELLKERLLSPTPWERKKP